METAASRRLSTLGEEGGVSFRVASFFYAGRGRSILTGQDHYYSERPHSASQPTDIQVHLRGHDLALRTDHGVFSRNRVDIGSALLANTAVVKPGMQVLDLGCGYGAVGIAVGVSIPDVCVWFVDVNERAVALTQENAARNGLGDRAIIQQGDGTLDLPDSVRFDAVLLNPPIRAGKATVWSLYAQARDRLKEDGRLYIVIQKKQGAESSEAYLRTLFCDVRTVAREHGYRIMCCEKKSDFKHNDR